MKFEVLTGVWLRIQVFCSMDLCHWVQWKQSFSPGKITLSNKSTRCISNDYNGVMVMVLFAYQVMRMKSSKLQYKIFFHLKFL